MHQRSTYRSKTIKRQAGEMEMGVEWISPGAAKTLLKQNTNNRPIRQAWVDQLTKMILDGDWQLSHQGIAFNGDGTLKDGQHRLAAIAQAGLTVPIVVTRNLQTDAADVIDVHQRRTESDVLGLKGYEISKGMVAIARRMHEGFAMDIANRLTRPELLRYVLKHLPAVKFANSGRRTKGMANASIRAPVARAWYTADRDRLTEFLECLATGINNGKQDIAAILLRNLLIRDLSSFGGGVSRTVLYRKVEGALIAFLEGRVISKIREASYERFVIPEEEEAHGDA